MVLEKVQHMGYERMLEIKRELLANESANKFIKFWELHLPQKSCENKIKCYIS